MKKMLLLISMLILPSILLGAVNTSGEGLKFNVKRRKPKFIKSNLVGC